MSPFIHFQLFSRIFNSVSGFDKFRRSSPLIYAYSIDSMLYAYIRKEDTYMKTIENFLEQLTSPEITDALVAQMLEHVEGFREDHCRYLSAVNKLKMECGTQIDDVVSAIHNRTASILFFTGSLGLKMNWDHFMNPMTPNCTWPQVDHNDYLRGDLACSLPACQQADAVLSGFRHTLTTQQQELYNAIIEYENHLLTVGPKLAHYYGYLLGDTLLGRLIPGYRPDTVLTIKYNTMLAEYLGNHFLPYTV